MSTLMRLLLAGVVGLAGLGGIVGGTLLQRSRCADALALADQNMADMTKFGITSTANIGAILIGNPANITNDPAYQRLLVNLPKYKDAAARCR